MEFYVYNVQLFSNIYPTYVYARVYVGNSFLSPFCLYFIYLYFLPSITPCVCVYSFLHLAELFEKSVFFHFVIFTNKAKVKNLVDLYTTTMREF